MDIKAIVMAAVFSVMGAFLILVITHLWDYIWQPFFEGRNLERLTNYMGNLKAQYNDVRGRVTSAGWQLKSMQEEVSSIGSDQQTIQVITSAGLEQQTSIQEVIQRLRKVESIEHEVVSIQNEYYNWTTNHGAVCSFWKRPFLSFKLFMKTRQVSELLDQGYFKDVAAKLLPPAARELPSTSNVLAMDSNLAQILHHLEENGVNIIGIWGMGGVGKTALLNEINNHFARNHHLSFDHVIFVVVSRDVNPEEFQKKVLENLGLPSGGDRNSRATCLLNFCKEKKVLLLLDDLWKYINLVNLGIPLGQGVCKLIFTTRSKDVCGSMNAKRELKVECLNTTEAWSLFEKNVGENTIKADPNICRLAKKVAEECCGLPLALITIGRAMSAKTTWREWQDALDLLQSSRHDEILGMSNDMFPILEFSYQNLQDDTMKECFLACSMWPEDFSILEDDLIICWMGLGLIDKYNEINKAYDRGHSIIKSLVRACLLEHDRVEYHRDSVKMHDVLRDLALWIALDHGKNKNKWKVLAGIGLKECKEEKWVGPHRISLMDNKIKSLPEELPDCPNLSVLTLYKNPLGNIPQKLFNSMRSLMYLDLSSSSIKELPAVVGDMINLKFLNLEDTAIQYLPDELRNLVNLKYLLLRGTWNIESIPWKSISGLSMLKLLDLFGCGKAPEMVFEDGFKALEQLDGRLMGLGISIHTVFALNRLSRFSTISIVKLTMNVLKGTEYLELLLPNHFGSKSTSNSLKVLHLCACESLKMMIVNSLHLGGIPRAASLPRLEQLELMDLKLLEKIVWRGVTPKEFLPSLCHLKMWGCHKLKDVSWVIQLPNLQCLELHFCDSLETVIGDAEDSDGVEEVADRVEEHILDFPRLRKLELMNLQNLGNICSTIISFPSLERIEVLDCPKLKRLPFQAPNIPNKLQVIWVKKNGGNI